MQANSSAQPDLATLTLGGLLDWAAASFGDNEALVFEGERLSYLALRDRVDACARGLVAAGVQPGERLALWMPNSVEWILTYFASARIGAVVVPVNTSFRAEEAAFVVGQSDSRTLVVSGRSERTSFTELAALVAEDARVSLDRLIVVDGEPTPRPGMDVLSFAEVLRQGEALADSELARRMDEVLATDPVITFYTSGTTGFPKGVVHSHKIIRNMGSVAERLALAESDVLVLYLPLFHVFASLAGVLAFMIAGAKIVLMPRFDPLRSLELMEAEHATVAYGMQPIYHDQMSHEQFGSFDLSALRLCITPAPPEYVRQVSARMGKAITVYGMTESTAMTTLPFLDDSDEVASETVGFPLSGFELRVVDPETGLDRPPGVPGEILVRGHQVMLGYYKDPAATAAVLEPDGWLHTGDLGDLTADGYLHFRGRLKETFRVGGENVDPVEVETVLGQHAAIGIAAVIGVPDERLGEVGAAFVQLKPGATVTAEELQAHVRTKLAGFKVPRRVIFVAALPRTASGKIQKFKLAQDEWLGLERSPDRVNDSSP